MKNKIFAFGAFLGLGFFGGLFLLRSPAQPLSSNQTIVWQSVDVGRVGARGSHVEDQNSGTHVLKGAGADIWSGSDGFYFAYQAWQGDVEFVARWLSVEKTHEWAKAGIMIRGNLAETSPHAMLAVTPEKGTTFIRRTEPGGRSRDDAHQAMRMVKQDVGVAFQQRGSAGADKATDSIAARPLPRWIKLIRRGDVIAAYDSGDGTTWEWLGTDRIVLGPQVFVGLAVTSHEASTLCTATFDNVSAKQPMPAPLPAARTGNGDGLQAAYFERMDFRGQTVKRLDATVNFDWGFGTPAEGIGRNNFSVRWEGELEAQFTEPYALEVVSDDRARLWLDGKLVIDEWYEHGEQASTAIVNLEADRRYSVRLDYFENRGRAVAKLLWSSPSTPQQVIPQSQLYSRVSKPTGQSFDSVRRPTPNPQLPKSWLNQDVGQIGQDGSAEASGGVWTLRGSGADIWANADGFHFAYQVWRGDGQIVAHLLSQQNSDPWAKAGIMMRESLESSSRHATLAVTPEHGVVFLHRDEAARTTAQEEAGAAAASVWLKLIRLGPIVKSFRSADGVNWEWIGTEAMYLADELYVGLAVNSHDNSALATATFDQVSLDQAPPVNPVSTAFGSGDGLQGSYFDGTSGRTVTRVDSAINFDWDIDAPAEGLGSDNFSARWEGYLEPLSDEVYALHVVSDDGARLWLDGQLVIDAWTDQGASEHTVRIKLQAGRKYPIKLEYYERTREAIAKLLWSTPTIPKQAIPQSQLYSKLPALAGAVSTARQLSVESSEQNAKYTTPGATGQKPPLIAAGSEKEATPEITGFVTVAEVPGAGAVARLGRWEANGTALYAVDRRGFLEYELNALVADVYQIEIEGNTHNLFDIDSAFYLLVSVDGESLGRQVLDAAAGQTGKVRVFTPWLKRGVHHVRLFWDNARKGRSLQVNAVRLQALQGPDADNNGVKDWVEKKLKTENGIETGTSSKTVPPKFALRTSNSAIQSATSPACLEGRGGFLSMMRIAVIGRRIVPQHGAGERWYANVPLTPSQYTAVSVSFQNDGHREAARIIWQPTDLLTSGDLVIRQGDSLLFQVGAASSRAPTVEAGNESARIDVAGQLLYVGPPKTPAPHEFNRSGTFTVTGVYTDANGASQRRSIVVRVVSGSFAESPVAWTGRERAWDCPNLPAEAVMDFDPRIQMVQNASLPQGGKRFLLKVDAGEDHWVLARLGEAGPVLAGVPIRGIDLYGASESGAFYGTQYEDGSRLVETAVVQSQTFPDVRVQLNIIVGGVMFDDGTLVKTLRAEDFDPTGLATVNFVMPPGVQTSNCHVMRAYQNQSYLGEY